MNEQAPYDSFYSRLTQASVWFYTNILRLGKYEDESIVNFVDAKENSNVLDYGCNTGRHARLVKQKKESSLLLFSSFSSHQDWQVYSFPSFFALSI